MDMIFPKEFFLDSPIAKDPSEGTCVCLVSRKTGSHPSLFSRQPIQRQNGHPFAYIETMWGWGTVKMEAGVGSGIKQKMKIEGHVLLNNCF